jgi:eukaryotic-like serine/threonine-protein kinase
MAALPQSNSQHPAAELATRFMGRTLGGSYRILELLDQGGMGAVFVAEHVRLRRRVAVKVLGSELAGVASALARFEQEAEVISRLNHPNIVTVLDFDRTESGEPYLVMELLQGESLAATLERCTLLPAREAVRVAVQVASGLEAAHRASIVHRDLKPANVFLLDVHGQSPVVKLLDFGISKYPPGARGLTGQFAVIGTPEYMSPEQAAGRTSLVDHRADQYSLAVITYEMLSGRVPFTGETVADILRGVLSEPPAPVSSLLPTLPADLDAVLGRALAKDPEQRYPSIAEFALALDAAIGQLASQPPPARAETRESSRPTVGVTVPSRPPRPSSGGYRATSTDEVTVRASTRPSDRPSRVQPTRASAHPGTIETEARDALSRAARAVDASALGEATAEIETALRLFARVQAHRAGSTPPPDDAATSPRLRVVTYTDDELAVLPKEAFLLSRIEGGTGVRDLVDLSPLPADETLRLLLGLVRRGLVRS